MNELDNIEEQSGIVQELTILGRTVNTPSKAIEIFKAPNIETEISFVTDEFTSLCPKTGQPDYYKLTVTYTPYEKCIESKSLKLYLWTFRETGNFCEFLAQTILNDLVAACNPQEMHVFLEMKPRGGIGMEIKVSHWEVFLDENK